MPIETWFPLAIYFDDLADAPQHQQALLDAVLQLERDGEDRRAYSEMAWTGDLHGVEQIQVVYPPVAGRLLMFPVKQRHAVTLNETEDLRVSLSFDIVLTAIDIPGQQSFHTIDRGNINQVLVSRSITSTTRS